MDKLKITIATPQYPPQLGGPGFYAKTLFEKWSKDGHEVNVVNFGDYLRVPVGIRHILYTLKLIPRIIKSDLVYVLDSFSVALPSVILCHIFRKKIIIRVGGDFLWESYINRTKEDVLLSEFYNEERKLSFKENTIFDLTDFIFRYSDVVVFSTEWQKNIFIEAYNLDLAKVFVIDNIYLPRFQRNIVPKNRVILSPSRKIFLKNIHNLNKAFKIIKKRFFDVELDTDISDYEELLNRINNAYVLVVPSLSEVSPNIVLDAISLGVPCVVTNDCGMKEVLNDVVVWIDPKDPESIASGIEKLMDAKVYSEYMMRMSKFTYEHKPGEFSKEFLNIAL